MDSVAPAGTAPVGAVAGPARGRSADGVVSVGTWVLTGVFVLALLAMLYRDYPFDGMVVEESWNLYAWSTTVHDNDTLSWPRLLVTRRGGSYGIRRIAVAMGSTPVAINLACVLGEAISVALFAGVVWTLGVRRQFVPIVFAAALCPFASGAHFWQIMLYHHVAVVLFLAALLLYLVTITRPAAGPALHAATGAVSLLCFWVSLAVQEHALLMPLLFVYLALYETNGRSTTIRFSRWWSPAIAFSLSYAVVTAVFVVAFVVQGHPRVSAGSGTHEWAASPAIRYAAVAVSSMLGLSSTVVANTVGYVGYPVLAVVQNAHALWNELGRWMPGVVAAAVVGAAVLALTLAPRAPAGVRDPFTRFGITVGALWALLIYVPVSTSFAYPRIVGQSADRANMLALFGVALCVGSLVAAVADRLGGHARPKVFAASFVAIACLLTNLYIQREYWVEAVAKETRVIGAILDGVGREALDGRQAVVLLEREHTPPPIRTRLMTALHEPGRVARAMAVARVVLARHFTAAGEIEVTGFHLRGIPLFGGATDNARWVTGNYARRLGRDAVPVFRVEQGFRARETPDDIIIEYVGQPESRTSYPKREYGIVRVKLAESFFDWRGAATYSAEPAAPSSIVTLEPSA